MKLGWQLGRVSRWVAGTQSLEQSPVTSRGLHQERAGMRTQRHIASAGIPVWEHGCLNHRRLSLNLPLDVYFIWGF